ncbi:MAG TPA: mechanosensitive ion channel family protein [Nitrospiria bacterium]|nr:mechanosensitive ion channel family protein [Candidatus Manganitrophaceae bacterium]HIL34146.1 mechanosensitive ion channel family protein [Candidatus Manganitrophaceae bacterium]
MLQAWLSQGGVPDQYIGTTIIVIKIIALLILCWVVNISAKKFVMRLVKTITRKTKNDWDDIFLDQNVFKNVSQFAPAFLIYFLAPIWFQASEGVIDVIKRVANAYMILVGCWVINAVLNSVLIIYQRFEVSRKKPIKGYLQAVKTLVYFLTALFVISTLMNKSPWGFLSIFGGLTAVILLIFKDMILGLVAGIQLTSNNMVARGDWIEMPKYGADGDIIDMTLTTIMVQNWDKTITTIPMQALINDSFKNWKGMSESEGRRIKRSICVDMNSIKFIDEALLKKLENVEVLKTYLKEKTSDIEAFNKEENVDVSALINGRRLTNVGTFRAYIVNYLRNHPKIHKDMTFLVRHLAPTEHGLPIEIYVFSNDQVWANYEAIQADIFDHVLAALPKFDLRVFQNPTGSDFQNWK